MVATRLFAGSGTSLSIVTLGAIDTLWVVPVYVYVHALILTVTDKMGLEGVLDVTVLRMYEGSTVRASGMADIFAPV